MTWIEGISEFFRSPSWFCQQWHDREEMRRCNMAMREALKRAKEYGREEMVEKCLEGFKRANEYRASIVAWRDQQLWCGLDSWVDPCMRDVPDEPFIWDPPKPLPDRITYFFRWIRRTLMFAGICVGIGIGIGLAWGLL